MEKQTCKDINEDVLFEEYKKTKNIQIRNEIVGRYTYIAKLIAKKFSGRGIDYDDLYQVACLGLLYAVERFDISKGIKFTSYAVPTVSGEIKRYFRDKGNFIRVPRKLYEMFVKADRIHEANKMGDDKSELCIPRAVSIEGELVCEDIRYFHILGQTDEGFLVVENKDFAQRCLKSLEDREREFVHKRFYEEKSQKQIAEDMGVSQMHISRMERRVLKRLRDMYFADTKEAVQDFCVRRTEG